MRAMSRMNARFTRDNKLMPDGRKIINGINTTRVKVASCTFFFLVVIFFTPHPSFATHNKAGEITFTYKYGLTYQALITTYTDSAAPADRPQLELNWGDGKTDTVFRANGPDLDGDSIPDGDYIGSGTKLNYYYGTHTYSGPSTYVISCEDPNRVDQVANIPNSVNTPFYLQTVILINNAVGYNNSPVLYYPPLDNGCVGQPFKHNPLAFDPDGDSLSYKLVICKGQGGADISGYTYPNYWPGGTSATGSLTLDAIIGDLVWDSPQMIGKYNLAFHIEEWRKINGVPVKIGFVTRDMEIIIDACNNTPPEIDPLPDFCIAAGDSLFFNVHASDPDNNKVTLTASGIPFKVASGPAGFSQGISGFGSVTGAFSWVTNCSHIRKYPYQVLFRAEDSGNKVHLVDLRTANITVVAPPVQNLTASPIGNSIKLTWSPSPCTQAIGYKLYRKTGIYSGSIPCPCTTGVPDSTGYVLIASLDSLNNTFFTDNNGGTGLTHGVDYCYIVVAVYPDNAESCASTQVCTQLKKDLPVITNVDIKITDPGNGSIYVAWSKPTELDTIQFPGPYKYLIYRSEDFTGGGFNLIDSLGTNGGLNDTVFTDIHAPVNTLGVPYSYKTALYNDIPARYFIGESLTASSVYLTLAPTDNKIILSWEEHVPWDNYRYDIFRKNHLTGVFDSIGTSVLRQYADSGLANDTAYCYKVRSVGQYSVGGFVNPIINFSEEKCAAPEDNVAPCTPLSSVFPDCEKFQNFLTWNNPNNSCSDDVLGYHIYYTPFAGGEYALIASLSSPADTTFLHDTLVQSIAGCYYVLAYDSAGNESVKAPPLCIDNCPVYTLPNIFTPDNNGTNDLFHPFPYRFVKEINIRIFNRWGEQVFTSVNPDINWDGINLYTKRPSPDGVYYYLCTVYFIHLDGIRSENLKGFLHLIR